MKVDDKNLWNKLKHLFGTSCHEQPTGASILIEGGKRPMLRTSSVDFDTGEKVEDTVAFSELSAQDMVTELKKVVQLPTGLDPYNMLVKFDVDNLATLTVSYLLKEIVEG